MTRRMPTARRSPGGNKSGGQAASIVSNGGHPHGKSNGQGTAHRVEEAIRASRCSATGEFFRVARFVFPNHAPEQCITVSVPCATAVEQPTWLTQELRWFGALVSGNPVPEGYKIPECVRLLTERVLENKDPKKCFADARLSSDRKLLRTPFSPGATATAT